MTERELGEAILSAIRHARAAAPKDGAPRRKMKLTGLAHATEYLQRRAAANGSGNGNGQSEPPK